MLTRRASHVVASGIGLTEGPAWSDALGLVVCSMSRGLLYRVQDGVAVEWAETGGSPNGVALGPDDTAWIAQNGGAHVTSRSSRPAGPSLQRAREGEVADVVVDGLDTPNDCTFGPDGRLWFTDPVGRAEAEGGQPGRVLAYDTATGDLDVVAKGILYPNGLAFGADPDDLYVAETITGRVLRAQVASDGSLGAFSTFCQLPAGGPDGLAVDRAGHLYAAATHVDTVFVFDPAGRLVEAIEVSGPSVPAMVTNLCFGGPDLATLYITVMSGGQVVSLPRDVPGLPLWGRP